MQRRNSPVKEGISEHQRMIERQKVEEQYSSEDYNQKSIIAENSPSLQPLKQEQANNKESQFKMKQKNNFTKVSNDSKDIEMPSLNNQNNDLIPSENDLLSDGDSQKKPLKVQKNVFSTPQQSTVNLGRRSLMMRRFYRIILLFIFEVILVGLFFAFYYEFGFFRGEYRLNDNESLKIEVSQCYIKIIDYSPDIIYEKDLNFYSTTSIPSEINENILLKYSYPNPRALGGASSMSYVRFLNILPYSYQIFLNFEKSNENGIRTFSFINGESEIDCEIAMYVYKETTLKQLSIDCGRDNCFVIIRSKKLKYETIDTSGYSIDFNASSLNANTITVNSFFGYVELNDAQFTTANIDVSTGDISIQSTKSIVGNLEMVSKLYCATTYSNIPITSTVADITPNCISVYPFGTTDKSTSNIVAQRCFKGSVTVKSQGSEPDQILNAKNTFGNIFINVLSAAGASAQNNQQKFFDPQIYGDDGNNVDLSVESKQILGDQVKQAQNPNVYDPIFQLTIGSQYTYSSSFTQWQITYNPAYTYLKPWWIGTLTFTLLTTQKYENDLTLAPGFCPFVPGLSQERIYLIQQLLKNIVVGDQESRRIITFGWQSNIELPHLKFQNKDIYDGIRKIDFTSSYSDDWIIFEKDKDGTIMISNTQLSSNQVLQAALIVSFILAFIVGLVFMVAIVFVVNQNYLQILDHMKHVDTYAQIQKLNEDAQGRDLDLEEFSTIEDVESNKKQGEEEEDEVKRISNNDTKQIKYTVTGILNLFYTLVYLSPPLSAYIDQVVLLFYKASVNSASSFFSLLFVQEKQQEGGNDEQIHNLEKDSISGKELKVLYEQYCYLNTLLERKLDGQQSINLLKSKGFKISVKQGALISYYSYILFTGNKKVIQDSENKSSLDLFIKYCCRLTKFDSDIIDSLTFEKNYSEFCNQNHMEQAQLNERELKREYGIETRYLPQQIVERDANYNYKGRNKKYNINQNRVKNNFMLMLSQDIESVIPENGNISELNDVILDIYTPKGWMLYDILTVLSHLCIVFFLGSPMIAIIIFIRIQQSPYSLIPSLKQLSDSDILFNTSVVPMKLMNDSNFIIALSIITLIFWALSTWDLMYYYFLMSFPQERYFQNYKNANYGRKLVSRIMWIVVLIAIYIVVIYLCLTITWLILGAIINPEAFLPYATSASTLVTIITKKYRQFKNLSEEGFKKLIQFIIEFSEKQFKDIVKKMDISEAIEDALPTNQIKSLIGEAENMNLIDPTLCQNIQNNIEIMTRDPNAVAHMGQEVFEIAQNPQAYASNLMNKLENKVKEELIKQVDQYFPLMSNSLIQALQNLFTGQKNRLKQDLTILFKDLLSECERNEKVKSNTKLIKSLQILKGPVISFIFDIAYPNKEEKIDDIKQKMIHNSCSLIQEIVSYQMSKNNNKQSEEMQSVRTVNLLEEVTLFNMKLFKHLIEKEDREYLNLILEVLTNEGLIEFSDKLQKVSQFTDILQLLIKIVDDKGNISAVPAYQRIRQFVKQILEESMEEEDVKVHQYIDFIVQCFFSPMQALTLPKFSDRKKLSRNIQKMYKIEDEKLDQIGSLTTLFTFWLSGQTFNIPTEAITEVLNLIKDQFPEYKSITDLIQSSNSSSSKNNARVALKMKKFQNLFNIFDILINNPMHDQQKLQESSKKMFGLDQKFIDFFMACQRVKYDNISSDDDFECIQDSEYFEKISKAMKINSFQLLGFLHLLLNDPKSFEATSCIKMIFAQFRVGENRIPIFINLYDLLTSDDERDLNSCLDYFKFNELGVSVVNGANQNVKIDSEMFALILLFLRDKYRTNIKQNSRIHNLFSKIFTVEIIKAEEYLKKILNLKFSSSLIPQQQQNQQEEFSSSIQQLLSLEKEGLVGQKTVSQILNIFQNSNPQNSLLKNLTLKEHTIFAKLIGIRNIPTTFPEIQTQIFKDSVQELASLLNVDEFLIQNFLMLITCSNQDKVIKVFKKFGIELEEEEEQFIAAQTQLIRQIEDKQNAISELQSTTFRRKIPNNLLEQLLLFNRLPSDSETLYFLLNSFFDQVSEPVKQLINFHYSIPTPVNQSNLQSQIKQAIKAENPKQNIEGLEALIKMFNNGSKKQENIKILLQFLHDTKKTCSLLLGSLITYLNGDGNMVQIQTDEYLGEAEHGNFSQKHTISVEQYLSRRLDIKTEFFTAFPSFFVTDTYTFAFEFIKFFRQVDYQIQREQNSLKNQQIEKGQIADVKMLKQSIKSVPTENQINRVTIQDKELEQFIRLFSRNSINASFFSRELDLPIDLVELMQIICLLKNSDDEKRLNSYDILEHSSSCLKVFSQIGVEMDEFITCVKFFYQDFEVSESSILQKGLKLPSKFPFSVLQNLLLLDVYLPPFDEPESNRKKLSQFIRSNQLIKDMKINIKYLQLLYVLYGDFTVLKTFSKGEVKMVTGDKDCDPINILLGLFGTLNKKKTEIDAGDFFKQIYQKLKDQNKLRGQFDRSQIRDREQTNKEKGDIGSDQLQKGNTFEYAIYLLCKEMYISPVWVLLMSGDLVMWTELCDTYYGYYKYEKEKQSHNNPLQSLIMILRMKQSPTIIKEFLIQNELAIRASKIYEQNEKDEIINSLEESQEQLLKEQNNILENIMQLKINSFFELAKSVQFPTKILSLIASYEYKDNPQKYKDIKYQESEADVETVLLEASKSIFIANKVKIQSSKNKILYVRSQSQNVGKSIYDVVKNIFCKVDWDFCEYADKVESKVPEDEYPHKKAKEYFGCNEIMQLVLISTLSNLQTSYYGYQNYTERDSDHSKLVSYEIDLFLSTIESFYFFCEKNNQISKFKIFYLIGLACGFVFELKEVLSCLPYHSIFNSQYRKNQVNSQDYSYQKKYFRDPVLKSLLKVIQFRKQSNADLINDKSEHYFRIFYNNVYDRISIQHSNQISQNIFDMYINNFEDLIKPQFQADNVNSIHELYISAQDEKTLFEELTKEETEYQEAIQIQNQQFLVDFYKENYESILENEYFIQRYEKELKYIVGVLTLNAAFISSLGDIEVEEFVDSLSLVSQYLVSNKRSLTQMLCLFIDGHEFNLSSLNDALQVKSQTIKSFASVYLNNKSSYADNEVDYLLSQTSYSETNKWVIKNIIALYNGELSQIMSLVTFSQNFQNQSCRSYQELYKFLNAVDTSYMHAISQEEGNINILELQYLSSEKDEQDELQNEILFLICNSIISSNGQQIEQKVRLTTEEQEEEPYAKFKREYYEQAYIIRCICNNDWDFLNSLQEDEIQKNAFCSLFDLNQKNIDLIQSLSLIKPDISGLKGNSRLNELLSADNIIGFINKIQPFGLCQTLEEQQQLKILTYVANESFPHLVNELNSIQKQKFPNLDQAAHAKRQEICQIFQSILMIKSSLKVNWLETYTYIKNDEFELEFNEHISIEEVEQFINHIIMGFDTFSSMFVYDILSSNKHEDTTEAQSQQSGSTQQTGAKKLFDFQRDEKSNFDIESYQNILQQLNGNTYSKSFISLHYIFKTQKQIEKQKNQNQKNENNISSMNPNPRNVTCKMLTQLICGEPYFQFAKQNEIFKKIKLVSKVFIFKNPKIFMNAIENLTKGDNNEIGGLLSQIMQFLLKLLYITVIPSKNSEEQTSRFKLQIESLIGMLKVLLGKNIFNKESKNNNVEGLFVEQVCNLILEDKKENLNKIFKDFHKFFFDCLNEAFPQIAQFFQFDGKKINKIYQIMQDLLDRPLLNLEDENLIQNLLSLLQAIDKDLIDKKLVENLINMIVYSDFNSLLQLIEYSNLVSQSEFKIIKESIVKISNLSIFENRGALQHLHSTKPVVSDQLKEINKRLQEGKITTADIFYSIDNNGNGLVSMEEFCNFLRRTGIQMSEHRVNELFATIKKNRNNLSDKADGNDLNFEEFEEAYQYINNKKTDMSLEKLGISPTLLAISLGTLIIILLLLLVFIFLGIKAFALGGTFGSIINSIIPAVATSGTAQTSSNKSDSLKEDNIKGVMKETELILHSNQL